MAAKASVALVTACGLSRGHAFGVDPAPSLAHHAHTPGLRRGAVPLEAVAGEESSSGTSVHWVSGAGAVAVGLAAALRAQQRRRAPQRPSTIVRSVATVDRTDTEEQVLRVTDDGTLVKKASVLVVGGTGTLGRQVVRQFLNAGYSVRCLIRNKVDRPFAYLVDWGATVVEGSLGRPETLASSLIGVHTVIDCSSARPEESIYEIDWEGKRRFIGMCEKMQIQRYIFTSIKDCDAYQNVPLMEIKHKTELLLQQSSLRYTILRLSGFMQPLITSFAVNILDGEEVWCDDGTSTGIAYVDSQDGARMLAAATFKERTIGKTITLTGPKVWSTGEVIKMCEQLSGGDAKVNELQTSVLQLTQLAAGCFDWSIDIAERLRFVEVNSMSRPGEAATMTPETYELLGSTAGGG